MKLTYKYLELYIFVIITSTILYFMNNKSNISKYIILPPIVALLTKYIIGDFNFGNKWYHSNIVYWLYILLTST